MALSEEERWSVAHHEAGHAVMAHLLDHADPVHKVTILPSGMSLGVTQQLPRNERHLFDRRYLLDTLAVHLGGRVAEELTCDDISTGAANDLASATQMARRMVRDWGMSDALGPMAFGSPGSFGMDDTVAPEWSAKTADVIDEEIARILREQEGRARALLSSHREALEDLARELVEHETLDAEAVRRIVERHPATAPVPTTPADAATPHRRVPTQLAPV
jgi:cell division protease FtsH